MGEYEDFLKRKEWTVQSTGFEYPKEKMCRYLFEYQTDIVYWALKKGKAAVFADCGLGKTNIELQFSQAVFEHTKKPVLIVAPLAVSQQTKREGEKFGFDVNVCRDMSQVENGINITNYEILDHFDPDFFSGIVLDESSILKNFTGKIRTQIIEMFANTPYKLSCTATPSPNDYMELGNQAEFLGVMSRTEMLSTYFIHDGGDTSKWRLKGHSQDAFWSWVAQWAVVMTNPSDLGYPGDNFVLPELNMYEHIIKKETPMIGDSFTLYAGEAHTLNERREARRNSLSERCKKAFELTQENDESWILWCGLNAEQDELENLFKDTAFSVQGNTRDDLKVEYEQRWRNGERNIFISKVQCFGYGMNWQHCHNMIFVGLSDSYEMLYQAIRRCWRFGQNSPVNVHIVISEEEGAVKANVERKEKQAQEMIKEMVKHTKEILEEEIRGTKRITISYDPKVEMVLPDWVKEEN